MSGDFFWIYLTGNGHGTALHAASACGRTAIVKLLLKYGADVNAVGVLDGREMTALKFALKKGDGVGWFWVRDRPSDKDYEEMVELLQSAQEDQRKAEQSHGSEDLA